MVDAQDFINHRFYLADTEGYGPGPPRECRLIAPASITGGRSDLILVSIDPPIIYHNLPHSTVLLASRHADNSLSDIRRWPVHVHVAVLKDRQVPQPDVTGRVSVARSEIANAAWLELHPTRASAVESIDEWRRHIDDAE